ncbi:unnamed protein product [Discula destructiva]
MAKSAYFAALTAALIALVALFINNPSLIGGPVAEYVPPAPGRNNTALFIVLPHHGLSNVHLATADALLERHPGVQVQFASFPMLEGKVKRISSWGQTKNQEAKPIVFHELPGRGYEDVLCQDNGLCSSDTATMPPGLKGLKTFVKTFSVYVSPWPAKEHLELYQHIRRIIDEVDPAVVVLDTLFAPAMDATRESNRLHSFITPNTLIDNFAGQQPRLGFFWKYPVLGSGHSFPVRLGDIPSNIWQAIQWIKAVLYLPDVKAKREYLIEHGIKKPTDFFSIHRDDAPWITQTTAGASVPVEFVPKNVSSVGPITVSVAPIAEQDAELSAWLAQHPSVLINLGSSVKYNEEKATIMANAIKDVLDQQSDVQVLWKMAKLGDYSDDYSLPLQDYISSGRLKLSPWLSADPTAILESGNVVAFVHHGGSNCYHEGVASGVPHVILPLWMDLYNFASLVETIGLGVWGCPETSPEWTSGCISEAVLKVIDGGEDSKTMQQNAKRIGQEAREMPGRYGAARIIAGLAGSGY